MTDRFLGLGCVDSKIPFAVRLVDFLERDGSSFLLKFIDCWKREVTLSVPITVGKL